MDTEQIKILLERYNQGSCSPEEAAIVDQWFENINRHQSTYIEEKELDRELDQIKSQLNQHIMPAPKVRRMNARYWYAAAAAAVLLAAGLFWFNQSSTTPATTNIPAPLASNESNRVIRNGFVEINTPKGHKESITLEDGSTMELNAGSKVRYPEHFGDSSRTIFLEEGEAFFNVATDPGRRFVVNAGELATTALGTSFNIRAYASEHKVIVALVSGKVKVDQLNNNNAAKTGSLILLPSEQISYDRVSLSLVKTIFNKPEEITGWQQGYLIFKDAPYNEIVTGIENRYGVTVMNESDKKEWNYNGSFKNENLKEVMDIISLAKSLSYTIKNDTVYLQNKN